MFTIFYSWQSDLPSRENRNLIEDALGKAARDLRKDEEFQVEPVIDRDTKGVPGSPNIVETILEKIDGAQVFVADVSLINYQAAQKSKTRPTPNPNVLVELGYALRTLDKERIILVMNKKFGPPEELPFDLRLDRITTYSSENLENERNEIQRDIQGKLRHALRTIVVEVSRYGLSEQAMNIARAILQASEHGNPHDTLTVEELEGSDDQIQDALRELESESLVRISATTGTMVKHFRPTVTLFARFDRQVMGWDTHQDAIRLGSDFESNRWDGVVNSYAEKLKWPTRRMNPALAYLIEFDLVETSGEIFHPWVTTFLVNPTAELRAWLKRPVRIG